MNLNSILQSNYSVLVKQCPIEKVDWPVLSERGIHFYVKREDLIDQQVSGNKIYKLAGYLKAAKEQGATTLVSFGGYYSNHLHALAAVGKELGLKTVGVVRGQRPAELNPTLQDCGDNGMHLEFITREAYRDKSNSDFLKALTKQYPNALIIPEGGGGELGLVGVEALGEYVSESFAGKSLTVCVPCGTGTTLAGLVKGGGLGHKFEGFAVVKPRVNDTLLEENVRQWLGTSASHLWPQWKIHYDFCGAGYAKVSPELIDFMREFELAYKIPLDPVYTGKMFLGIEQLAKDGHWRAGDTVLAIHTGGLQGRRGFPSI